MELLNWFKKPLRWWFGILLIVVGTIFVRGIEGCSYCVEAGATAIFLGLMAVLLFGKTEEDQVP